MSDCSSLKNSSQCAIDKLKDKINNNISANINDISYLDIKMIGTHTLDLLVVSDEFKGKSQLKRHRDLYYYLTKDITSLVHAINIRAYETNEFDFSDK